MSKGGATSSNAIGHDLRTNEGALFVSFVTITTVSFNRTTRLISPHRKRLLEGDPGNP